MELTADESYYLGVDYYLDIEEGKITWIIEKEENTEEKIENETEETQVPEVSGDSINAPKVKNEPEQETANTDSEENQIQNEGNDSSVAAYAINEWNVSLNDDNSSLKIDHYYGSDTNVVIPETLDWTGTDGVTKNYPITKINDLVLEYK